MLNNHDSRYRKSKNTKTFECIDCSAYGSISEMQIDCPHCGSKNIKFLSVITTDQDCKYCLYVNTNACGVCHNKDNYI